MSTQLKFKPSKYQQDIINEINTTNNDILVNAKAGSGKTSTLLLISEALKQKNCKSLFLAFNKSVVQDLRYKIDTEYCDVKTVHSLGYTLLNSYCFRLYGKDSFELEIDNYYFKKMIQDIFEDICRDEFNSCLKVCMCVTEEELNKLYNEVISDLVKLGQFVRYYMVDYTDENAVIKLGESISDILTQSTLYGISNYPQLVNIAITQIIDRFNNPDIENNKKIIKVDFTDMLWLPTRLNISCPYKLKDISCVLVDECQDLNVLQQNIISNLTKFNPNMRYIFVGDEKQSIYGFAGADVNSINNLKNRFNLKELPLNTCYRCPENIVKIARTIVPDIEWNKEREDKGSVCVIDKQSMLDFIKPGDMVIARSNRELLEAFKYFAVEHQFPIKFSNSDSVKKVHNEFCRVIDDILFRFKVSDRYYEPIIKYIEENKHCKYKHMEKLYTKPWNKYKKNIKHVTVDTLCKAMQEYSFLSQFEGIGILEKVIPKFNYADEFIDGYRNIIKSFVKLYSDCCTELYDGKAIGKNQPIQSFITYLEDFLNTYNNKNVPMLSSVHKMKGSEASNVFIYNYPYFPYTLKGQKGEGLQIQETNLQYVALTRAKSNLYLCMTGDLEIDLNCVTKLEKLNVL